MRRTGVLLFSILMVPGFLWARQNNPAAGDANEMALAIVNTANQGEIKMGQYMAQHGSSSAAKQYAQELQSDHQNAEDKLKAVMGRDLSNDVDPTLQQGGDQELKEVQQMHGSQADRYFERTEVADHQKVISQLQKLEPNITDPKLKSYVESVIPVLKKHLADGRKAEGAG